MKRFSNILTPFFFQRIALIIFCVFPILPAIFAQTILLLRKWDFMIAFQMAALVALFLVPIFTVFWSKLVWVSIEEHKHLAMIWVIGVAVALRIVFIPMLSTNFVSDMEDIHFLAVDISFGDPLSNLHNYPNIPDATHLNMTAMLLSFIYRLLGTSTANAKLLLVVLGVLTTWLVYLAGREIADVKTGFLASYLFASLPSIVCYTGVLTGDHVALPLMVLALYMYARTNRLDRRKSLNYIISFSLVGIVTGFVQWFRPMGLLLLIALIFSVSIYQVQKRTVLRKLVIVGVLIIGYTAISNIAVVISENIFETEIRSASQRVGGYLFAGMNPESGGIVTLEDAKIIQDTYEQFGDDSSGARAYLTRLAFDRLEPEQLLSLLQSKFTLIWASHDALFDYALAGSNDHELVNLMRNFESLLYLILTIFIFINALFSMLRRSHPAVFAMQLFILGFALLLLLLEVQNRYVIIVIPYSIILGVLGMKDAFLYFQKRE